MYGKEWYSSTASKKKQENQTRTIDPVQLYRLLQVAILFMSEVITAVQDALRYGSATCEAFMSITLQEIHVASIIMYC